VYHALPCLVPDSPFGIFNNSIDVAALAITERQLNLKVNGILTTPIQPVSGAFQIPLMVKFAKKLAYMARRHSHVYSHREVVEMYDGRKRKVYEQAFLEFQHSGCLKKHSFQSTFIKFEKCNVDKAPRIICPRHPVYNLCLGRYLKKSEHIYCEVINKLFGAHTSATVVKGLNVIESATVIRQKWERFADPVGQGGDCTKYDMHHREDALKFEHRVYNDTYKQRALKRLLSWQLEEHGTVHNKDGSIVIGKKMIRIIYVTGMSHYVKPETDTKPYLLDDDVIYVGQPEIVFYPKRASGDLNTSQGNIIVICAIIYSFINFYGLDIELVDNGDDFFIISERSCANFISTNLPPWFRNFGFIVNMEQQVDTFESIEFCQTNPVLVNGQWRMCRHPKTVLMKDIMCTVPLNGKNVLRKWLDAVGQCGLAIASGVPILQSFYAMYVRNGIPCGDKFKTFIFQNTGTFDRMQGLTALKVNITESTRYSFYKAFGVLPDTQRDLEEYFDLVFISDTVTEGREGLLIRDSGLSHNSIFYEIPW
jgi:hypothetical protein